MLNEGLVSIAADAFSGSSLDELVIPDSVTNLQKNAIANAKHLVKLVLGSGVTQAQVKDAVSGCESLQEINVSDSSPVLRAQDGVLFTADLSTLVMYPTGRGGAYSVPDQVSNVGMAAFKGASATSISLNAATSIGDSAFEGSSLQTVDLGSVRSIGESAFASCANLTSIDFMSAQALESIGAAAFSPSTPLQAVELTDAVSYVGSGAFANNSALRTVRLGASFTGEYSSVFAGCDKVESLQVSPGNALYLADESVLYRKADDGLHLQRSLPSGKLSSYTVKEGTVAIGSYAFAGNDTLESVVIPEGVKTIETAAFTGCTQLSQVSFPDSLETVTGFYDTALEFVEFGTGIREIKSSAFNGHNPLQLIVRGGQDGKYASSLESTDEVQPMKSAYFGEGMKSADFSASAIAPPSVVVVPSTMTSLKFNAPSTTLAYDPASIVVYAAKDTAGWKAAKAALESIGADASKQLVPYQALTVSAESRADAQSGKIMVTAEAVGGALASSSSSDETPELRTAFEYRFVSVANDGAERVVQDWSEAAVCTLNSDEASRMTIRCEVRDATGLTAQTEAKAANDSAGDDDEAAKEAAEKAAREAAEKAAHTVSSAKVAKAKMTYTGKALKPAVSVTAADGSLVAAANYTVKYANNVKAGTACVTVTGKGGYSGSATATFKVVKATAKAKVVKTKSFKASALKKKAKSFKAVKLTTDGKASWKVVKNNAKKALTFKAGKIVVRKGTKAGTYTIKVRASTKAGQNYKALKAKTYTIKVKVK